jgi:hypothetical protein
LNTYTKKNKVLYIITQINANNLINLKRRKESGRTITDSSTAVGNYSVHPFINHSLMSMKAQRNRRTNVV